MNQQLHKKLIEAESELQRLQKSYSVGDRNINNGEKNAQRLVYRDDRMITTAQKEVSKARESQDKFAAKKNGVRSNLANGIASGLASGIISAAIAGSMFCTVM
ncbi:hypothetical protein N7540_003254 [Penicillium herquei]|nr:hypothetical protein N7540_003254 [Penicillium herquei]